MIKRMATAVALSALLATAAFAQSPAPAPSETPPAATPAAPATAPAAQPSTEMAPVPADAASAAAPAPTPTSLDECIAAASNLGQMAETKTLPEDKLDKLDELFTKMESLCDAKNFTEAASVAKDIRTMLDGQ